MSVSDRTLRLKFNYICAYSKINIIKIKKLLYYVTAILHVPTKVEGTHVHHYVLRVEQECYQYVLQVTAFITYQHHLA